MRAEVVAHAQQIQAEKAARKAKRRRRDDNGPTFPDGWRVLPKSHAQYDGEMAYVLYGQVYATHRGPAQKKPDGVISRPMLTVCLGPAADIWPGRAGTARENDQGTPQWAEKATPQNDTKIPRERGRPTLPLDTGTALKLHAEGRSLRAIAQHFGCSEPTISRRLGVAAASVVGCG